MLQIHQCDVPADPFKDIFGPLHGTIQNSQTRTEEVPSGHPTEKNVSRLQNKNGYN